MKRENPVCVDVGCVGEGSMIPGPGIGPAWELRHGGQSQRSCLDNYSLNKMNQFKKQSGFALPSVILILVILIAAALIIIGGTRYYSYKTFQELKEAVKEPEMVRPEQIVDETTDWKVYQSEKYGYEVKYPPDWKTKERSLMSGLGHRDFIWIQNNGDEFSVDVWDFSFYSYDQLTEPPPGGIDPDTINKKEIIIDDQSATELSYVAVGDGGLGARRVREVFIQKNQLLYKIRSTDSKECDQILSTFKFIK